MFDHFNTAMIDIDVPTIEKLLLYIIGNDENFGCITEPKEWLADRAGCSLEIVMEALMSLKKRGYVHYLEIGDYVEISLDGKISEIHSGMPKKKKRSKG